MISAPVAINSLRVTSAREMRPVSRVASLNLRPRNVRSGQRTARHFTVAADRVAVLDPALGKGRNGQCHPFSRFKTCGRDEGYCYRSKETQRETTYRMCRIRSSAVEIPAGASSIPAARNVRAVQVLQVLKR